MHAENKELQSGSIKITMDKEGPDTVDKVNPLLTKLSGSFVSLSPQPQRPQCLSPGSLFLCCVDVLSKVYLVSLEAILARYFSDDVIKNIAEAYSMIDEQYRKILVSYVLNSSFNNDAREYAVHGFARRIGTLKRCLHNIFQICPLLTERLSYENKADVTINIQSFMVNAYGALDNLAWIWVKQKKLCFLNRDVGLTKNYKKLRTTFSQEFLAYLESRDKYLENYLTSYRHALAHRIPLYIPPFILNKEESEEYKALEDLELEALSKKDFSEYTKFKERRKGLGKFSPQFLHSFSEDSKPILFHPQLLADWATIVEFSEKFKEELFRNDDVQEKVA